jgi:hypothetical protein
LTVAVVDDAGRLLDVCEVSDDPGGYAQLGALLVERSSGPTGVAIAADSDDHLVTSLLTAAGRPLAIADDDAVDDYAERFADDESVEEMESPAAERRAVGLARALQAGALSAVALPVPRDLLTYKPVLAAHAALCNGRLSAAVALREVLRELYPAALRAYPDPAEPVSLAVLDALPEPSLLNGNATGRGRESTSATDAVISQLAAEGVADAETVSEKITALRVAIAETPRRGTMSKALVPAISETVRQAVAAVRACDLGCDALISTLSARLTAPPATSTSGRRTVRRSAANAAQSAAPISAGLHAVRPPAEEPAPTRVGRRARPEPAAASAGPAVPQAVTAPPVAPAPVTRPPVAPPPVNRPAAARGGDTGRRHAEPPARPAAAPASAPPVAPASAPPLAPAASAEPAVRPSVAPPPVSRPPVAPAAISAPTPLPIRSSAPPARPAAPTVYGGGMADTAQIAMPLSRPEPRVPEPPRTVQPPRAPEPVSNRPVSAPPPPPPGITPIAPAAAVPSQRGLAPADSGEPFRATLTTAAINSVRAERQRPTPIPPRPNTRHDAPPPDQSGATTQSGFGATDLSVPLPRHAPEPGSRAAWPLVNSSENDRTRVDAEPSRSRPEAEPAARSRPDRELPTRSRREEPAARSRLEAEPAARGGAHQRANGDGAYSGYSELDRPAQQAATDGRVKPPWQADDLPQEPPMLRLVEPPPLADRALDDRPLASDRPLTGMTALDSPSLRLVDVEASDRGARTARSRRAVERSAVPVAEEGDGDLLIFAETRSAWFVGHPEDENQVDWTTSADTGWQAASQAATPAVGAETTSGLPRRVPQANLVPGSALPPREERPLRIVRDAQSIAAHTTGYFRGWRRGQEIGGYAVGGRPGRESAGGWDFSRDSVDHEDEYRSAGYRS